jgi:two-component system sensor histidine kinase YesM
LTYGNDEVFWSSPYLKLPAKLVLPESIQVFTLSQSIGAEPYFRNWQMTGRFDSSLLFRNQLQSLGPILLIALALSMLSVLLIRGLLNSLSRRISALSSHMKTIGDGRMAPLALEKPGKDEVGFLIMSFNDMISEINGLINDVYKLEMQKKDAEMENMRAEYKYLQAQADPHFLFNTLNAVLVYCAKNKYDELAKIIGSLSKLTKRMLTQGGGMITLAEEFDFIERYLMIEKFRFGSMFSYDVRVDHESAHWPVPKLSVQPLVENACKHGLQNISGKRELSVIAVCDGEGVKIIVADNGIGMDESIWQQAIAYTADNKSTEGSTEQVAEFGIGLQNVYRRMRMCFGDKFHFHIKSAPGQGACVEMRIDNLD